MKRATPALISYLATHTNVIMSDIYTFALVGSGTLRFIDYAIPNKTISLVAASDIPGSPLNTTGVYSFVKGPLFGRSKVTTKVGIEPSELTIRAEAKGVADVNGPADTIDGEPWQAFALQGGFDNAMVELDRLFIDPNSNQVVGGIVWFYGKVADIDVSRTEVKFTVKSLLNILQEQQIPRRLFQAPCGHVFGDVGCGYDRFDGVNSLGQPTGAGLLNVTAQAGSEFSSINIGFALPDFFGLGTCTGISGVNAGLSRAIEATGTGTFTVKRPFPHSVNAGDTFQLLPGCDHTVTRCNNTFNNLQRYGGFPYIPSPELALGIALMIPLISSLCA